MQTSNKRLSFIIMNNLPSHRLLAYYRAERKRYKCAISTYHWGFDAVDYIWDHSDNKFYLDLKLEFDNWWEYLMQIKEILKTKKHVARK